MLKVIKKVRGVDDVQREDAAEGGGRRPRAGS
jgi:hypothetical protein